MQLDSVMTRDPEIIRPDITVRDAARRMESLCVGFLPVGENGRIVGVVTDRDLVIRALAHELNPDTTTVADVMTAGVVTLPPETEVEDAARVMEGRQIRRIVVADNADHCVGVVSLGDLAVKTPDAELVGEVLVEVSEPARPAR